MSTNGNTFFGEGECRKGENEHTRRIGYRRRLIPQQALRRTQDGGLVEKADFECSQGLSPLRVPAVSIGIALEFKRRGIATACTLIITAGFFNEPQACGAPAR
jgi:hypothetical protein